MALSSKAALDSDPASVDASPASATRPKAPRDMHVELVLVAVDLTERSGAVIEHALAFARALDAKVRLVHVCKPPVLLGTPTGEILPGVDLDTLEAAAHDELALLVERYADMGVELSLEVVSGDVADTIIEMTQDPAVGMLVVGTHGRQGIAHAILGSTAENIVRAAHCPVLTLHA